VVVTCSCNYFTRKHGPCRHFYGVVNRGPCVEDFAPDCYKSYEVFYGTNEAFTERCDASTNLINAHGGLIINTSLMELKSSLREEKVNLPWYREAWSPLGVQTNPHCVKAKLSDSNGPYASGSNPAPFGFTYSSGANALEEMADESKQSMYTRTYKLFTEAIQDSAADDYPLIRDALLGLRGDIQSRNQSRTRKGNAGKLSTKVLGKRKSDVVVVDFPEVETRRVVPRGKPSHSPGGRRRPRQGTTRSTFPRVGELSELSTANTSPPTETDPSSETVPPPTGQLTANTRFGESSHENEGMSNDETSPTSETDALSEAIPPSSEQESLLAETFAAEKPSPPFCEPMIWGNDTVYHVQSDQVDHLALFRGSRQHRSKFATSIGGNLKPGDLCLYNDYTNRRYQLGIVKRISTFPCEVNRGEKDMTLAFTDGSVLAGPVDKRVMIFRADENGTLQDCTDGHWVQPNCLDIREGVLSPDFYSTPGDDMKAAMENARRRREEIMIRDGLLREDETLDIGLDQQDPNAQNEHLIAAMQKIMHQLYHGKMPRHEDDSDVSSIDDDSTARR